MWRRHAAGVWAHEVKQLERGCVLIETGDLVADVHVQGQEERDMKQREDAGEALEAPGHSNTSQHSEAVDITSHDYIQDLHLRSCAPVRKVCEARVVVLLSHDEAKGRCAAASVSSCVMPWPPGTHCAAPQTRTFAGSRVWSRLYARIRRLSVLPLWRDEDGV